MNNIKVQVAQGLVDRIDAWINDTGRVESLDDAVRHLLEVGLGASTKRSIHLTDGDKLNFMMLRDIANHLNINDGESKAEFLAEVISGGHYWAPVWEMQGIFHNHSDSEEALKLVVDTLDMWSFIEEGLAKLSDEDLALVKEANHGFLPEFSGFDGNNEGELMSIARFFIDEMNRFSNFKGRSLNSHSPAAAESRRMTEKFSFIRSNLGFGKKLTATQIIDLINA